MEMERLKAQKKGYIGRSLITYFRLKDLLKVILNLLDNGYAGFPPCSRCPVRPRKTYATCPSDWSDKNKPDPRKIFST
jgi:hypothetical protein